VRFSWPALRHGPARRWGYLSRIPPGWLTGLPPLLAIILYLPTLSYDFVWDDVLMIVQNQYFKHARYIPLYFTSDFARLTSGGIEAVYYRPFLALSFLMDFSVWGNSPGGYHLTNVLLYATVVWLVAAVGRRLYGGTWMPAAAAAVFALHPIHVEAVAFISARNHVLPAMGMLLALAGYHRFRHGPGRMRWMALTGSALAFAFGLLSTETALSLPLVLVWYELTLGGRRANAEHRSRWSWGLPFLPHVILGLGFLWLRWGAVESLGSAGLGPDILWRRLPGTLEILARYTVLAAWPFGMQPAYIPLRPESLLQPWPLAGLLILAASAVAIAAWWRRQPEAAFALGWFLIAMAPVADLVPLAPRALNMADRYLFIPSLGVCWLVALAGRSLWERTVGQSGKAAIAFGVATGGILLSWTGSTLAYAPVWRDNITLFSRMVRDLPHAAFAYNNLGLALLRSGNTEEAIQALETAVRLDPEDVRSQLSLARTYVEQGEPKKGFQILDRLTSLGGHDKMYFLVRGSAHMAVGEWDAARQVLSRGLQLFPELGDGYQALGFVLEQQGKTQEAMDAYRQAVRLRPDLAWAHLGLARIQLDLGQPGEAVSAARAALSIVPEDPLAARILAEAQQRITPPQPGKSP
jgi:tetratricopeptide (TPR) repeat protein